MSQWVRSRPPGVLVHSCCPLVKNNVAPVGNRRIIRQYERANYQSAIQQFKARPQTNGPNPGQSDQIRPLKCFLRNEAKLCRPFRAQYILVGPYPGRCPGLSYYRPFRTRGWSVAENYETNPSLMDRRFKIADLRWGNPAVLRLGASAVIYKVARKQMGTRVTCPSNIFLRNEAILDFATFASSRETRPNPRIRLDPTFEIFSPNEATARRAVQCFGFKVRSYWKLPNEANPAGPGGKGRNCETNPTRNPKPETRNGDGKLLNEPTG